MTSELAMDGIRQMYDLGHALVRYADRLDSDCDDCFRPEVLRAAAKIVGAANELANILPGIMGVPALLMEITRSIEADECHREDTQRILTSEDYIYD